MKPRRKVVVFLDGEGRQGTLFDPFAAALRRRALRTARLTSSRPSPARFIRDMLFYSDVVHLRPDREDAGLAGLSARYEIADIQLGEATLAQLGLSSPATAALARSALACKNAAPAEIFDKFALNERLAEAGVLVPHQVPADEIDAGRAARTLGLPLLVKRRVAEGGRGVHIADTPAEAEALLEAWRTPRAEAFFQRHIPGELVMYGALFDDAGPVLERCFRATQLQDARGPSARIAVAADPDVARAGRQIAQLLGLRGLAQFDFIRDVDGRLWHIDANARCWGSMLAANARCADFISAYERLLAGLPPEADRTAPTADDIGIHPHSILAAAATGSWSALIAEWRDFRRFCRSGPGPAYGALIGLKAATIFVLSAGRPRAYAAAR